MSVRVKRNKKTQKKIDRMLEKANQDIRQFKEPYIGLIPKRYPSVLGPRLPLPILPEKVILLNQKNLEKLRAYKAIVQIDFLCGELIIIITGLTKSARKLFDDLEALPPEEVYGK